MKLVLAVCIMLLSPLIVFAQVPTTILADFNRAYLMWDWEKGTGGDVELFMVKCGNQSGVYNTAVSVDKSTFQAKVSSVVPAVGEYFCVVTAKNRFGESNPSNEIHFEAGIVPVGPANLRMVIP